jgi:hypothetical protein
MKIKAKNLLLCLGYIFAHHTVAMQWDMKIGDFQCTENEGEVQITRLVLKPGLSFLSLPSTCMNLPKEGEISVFGILEGYSSAGISGINSIDRLIEKYRGNPLIQFAVIQIGRLSEKEKKSLRNTDAEDSRFNLIIKAIKRAKYVTFKTGLYSVDSQIDQFLMAFKEAISS